MVGGFLRVLHRDITEILLKIALNFLTLTPSVTMILTNKANQILFM